MYVLSNFVSKSLIGMAEVVAYYDLTLLIPDITNAGY